MTPDFRLHGSGSVYLLWADTRRAQAWAAEHLPDDAARFAGAVAIEHRFVLAVVDGISQDGLTIGGGA